MVRLKPNRIRKNNNFYIHFIPFRSRFSTNTCLNHLTDLKKFEMDKNNSLVLLDHRKAFDTNQL